MKKLSFLRKYAGTAFACMALFGAQMASTQFSIIYYQDKVPEKVKKLKRQATYGDNRR